MKEENTQMVDAYYRGYEQQQPQQQSFNLGYSRTFTGAYVTKINQ